MSPTTSASGTHRYRTDELAEISRAAEPLLRLPYECWHFGDSVGFEALLAASEITGDGRFAGFAHGFARAWAARSDGYRPLDCTAPGLAMVHVAERARDSRLMEAVARLADHLQARRTIRGVYATFETAPLRQAAGPHPLPPAEAVLLRDPGAGVFVDCLHFDPPFFAALGRATGETIHTARAVEQALGYIELLHDDASGLFHHYWLERMERPYILGWSRGQGWALLGLLDVLEETRDAQLDPGHRATIEDSARRLATAMRGLQRPDGHWYTVAHDETSGDETSTAAFMANAFSRGMRTGLLDDAFAEPAARALAAIRRDTDADGVLRGVSAAVWACTLPAHYANVPRDFLVPWGQGPLVLALAEAMRSGSPDTERSDPGSS